MPRVYYADNRLTTNIPLHLFQLPTCKIYLESAKDRFNHAYATTEDIIVHAITHRCPDCRRYYDTGCQCLTRKSCAICRSNLRECKCQLTDRPVVPEQAPAGGVQYPLKKMAILQENGEWQERWAHREHVRDPREHIEIVLTQDIDSPRELYNCYGRFTNSYLLERYGFIDEYVQNISVCLRSECFDTTNEHYIRREDRCRFWETEGFQFVQRVCGKSRGILLEFEQTCDLTDCAETGSGFVDWSLSIQDSAWPRVTLRIWFLVCNLSDEEWDQFKSRSLNSKARQIWRRWLQCYEQPPSNPDEVVYLRRFMEWIREIVRLRHRRYGDLNVQTYRFWQHEFDNRPQTRQYQLPVTAQVTDFG
jgi:hypothetical protein